MQRILLAAAAIVCVAAFSATDQSRGSARAKTERSLPADFAAPPAVRAILDRACKNCHSAQTDWPWYANLPPVSWKIHSDVEHAREFMDLSNWSDYTPEERRSFAAQISIATRAHAMPPSPYLWMHSEAKLSDADLKTLRDWARNAADASSSEVR